MLGAIYIGDSTQFDEKPVVHLPHSEGCLVLPTSVAEFNGLCMQFEEKQLCTLVA